MNSGGQSHTGCGGAAEQNEADANLVTVHALDPSHRGPVDGGGQIHHPWTLELGAPFFKELPGHSRTGEKRSSTF